MDYFDTDYWGWNLLFGVQDGAMSSVWVSGVENPPLMEIMLMQEEYFTDGEVGNVCSLNYEIEGRPASSWSEAWLDWELQLTPTDTDCANLDPEQWGEDPHAAITAGFEVTVGPLDPDLATVVSGWFSDWESGVEPYTFGSNQYVDGALANGYQTAYGWASEVDEDMNMVSPETYGVQLTTDQLTTGPDAFYDIRTAYVYPLGWGG